MYLKLSIEKIILILHWLFLLFPLSIIAGNAILNLNFVIFIVFGIIYLLKIKKIPKYDFLVLIFFFFCLTLIISSILNETNITKSFLYLRFLFFYYICFYLFNEKKFDTNKIFFFYAIFVFLICTDVVIQNTFGYNIVGLKIINSGLINHPVATSFFQDEKIAGSFIQGLSFFLVFYIFNKFNKKSAINFIIKSFLLSLISVSILISFQRMPMVLWVVSITVYGIIYYKTKLLPILLSFVFLTAFIFNFSSQVYFEGIKYNELIRSYNSFFINVTDIGSKTFRNYSAMKNKKKYDEVKTDKTKALFFENGSGHASLFASAFFIWEDNKILGTGYKNFYNKCVEKKLHRCTNHPHNSYLDVLVSTGLVGFLLLVTYLITLLLKIIYSLKINLINKNAKKNEKLLVIAISFFMYFFPLKSAGSFFTTANSTFMMIILVILISQLNQVSLKKINSIF